MVTSHRPGKLKQKNKQHKTGKHRSKGQLALKNKGNFPSPMFRVGRKVPCSAGKKSKPIVFHKSARKAQRAQNKQMKQIRLKNIKMMLGHKKCPRFITFLLLDNSITMPFILNEIMQHYPNGSVENHSCNQLLPTSSLADVNCHENDVYLNFVPHHTCTNIITAVGISHCVVVCSSVSNRFSLDHSQMASLIDIIQTPTDNTKCEVIHYCHLDNSVEPHLSIKYLNAYSTLLNGQPFSSHNGRNKNIFTDFSMVFKQAYHFKISSALEKVYSNIKTPNFHLRPYLIIDKVTVMSGEECSADALLSITVCGVLFGNHVNSTNKYVHFPGFGDFPLLSIRAVQRDLISNPDNVDDYCFEHPLDNDESLIDDNNMEIIMEDEATDYSVISENKLGQNEDYSFDEDSCSGNLNDIDISERYSEGSYLEDSEIDSPHIRYHEGVPISYVPLREQLKGYRGMDSLKNSYWDRELDLPPEYSKICKFSNFEATKKRSTFDKNVLAATGSYVSATLKGVPRDLVGILQHLLFAALKDVKYIKFLDSLTDPDNNLSIGYFLFEYENKISLNHYMINRVKSYPFPIETNQKLLIQADFRYFLCTGYLFSECSNQHDKWSIIDRIENDSNYVISLYGPIVYPPSSVRVFLVDPSTNNTILIATGTVMKPDPDRIILHRKDISGHIHKNYRRYVIIKDMFDNMDDVNYYKPIALHTRSGHVGHIMESVGTHGSMKCKFDGHQRQQENVTMSLYKRVFPRWEFQSVLGNL